ncbi:PLP-dependent cysteine synthase family protein [Desulfomonile tiedjei]|uniref:cysteine synthase n=1 Tax=Desulfomonile tiedjei (strain ATCC 49306 / DSM 6799 / DCB-1) TaxID=706587 RepID=I4BZR8_DESTA|nr:PLP-dependent cysteine synthase family protein [Desulfomonile tiedjei]AFM22809.1 cysteine synthase [Desulfomonile tiedjei DSM 6799]
MSILDLIGNTPLVRIGNPNGSGGVRILGKLEGNNPGGSVKDRIAYYMIAKAEENGSLTKDKIILEPTSGNTGIGLSMVAACKGYRCLLTLPECVSLERRNTLRAYGAELEITPPSEATDGAIRRAHRIYEEDPEKYFFPNQFENEFNAEAHYMTTGLEIIRQTGGEVDAFVAGMGTTGTLMGISRRLKEHNPRIQIVGVEPEEGHTIQGLKNMSEAIVPKIYDPKRLDRILRVNDQQAYDTARWLALNQGIFVGMSSGAAVYGAMQISKEYSSGTVVCLLPDRGDRYLSTTLFKSICAKCPP